MVNLLGAVESRVRSRPALRTAFACAFVLLVSLVGSASAIPAGWTCIGACGTSGADGDVIAPPSGPTYDFVTTDNGVDLGTADLNLGPDPGGGTETNGSILRSVPFLAAAGDDLVFSFNYVTSDGAEYSDYAWARLLDPTLNPVGLLLTARTTVDANTVPGFGMPANSATLSPPNTPIIGSFPDDGPVWSPLGADDSGECFANGCGYTGWIQSTYHFFVTGTYILEFGTVNWLDQNYDSGLAFAGTTIAGVPVPEPGTLILLGSGLIAAVLRSRSRRRTE